MPVNFTRDVPVIRSALLRRAVRLSPRDTNLMFLYSNTIAQELRYTNRDPTANRSESHLRGLHKKWLKTLITLTKTFEGKFVPSIFNNIGSAYKVLGKDRQSATYYRRAAGLSSALRDGLVETGVLKPKGPPPSAFDPESLRRKFYALSSDARDDAAETLHSLDTVLRYQLAQLRRRRVAGVDAAENSTASASSDSRGDAEVEEVEEVEEGEEAKAAAVAELMRELAGIGKVADALGLFGSDYQRAPHYDPSLRPACPWHHASSYGPLVSILEAAKQYAVEDMNKLLEIRASGDAAENGAWYTDHERITNTPSRWWRRHVDCTQTGRRKMIQEAKTTWGYRTCAAVVRAQRWWYAREGEGDSSAATPRATDGLWDDKAFDGVVETRFKQAPLGHHEEALSILAPRKLLVDGSSSNATAVGVPRAAGAVDPFYLKAQYSLLSPRPAGEAYPTWVRPHVGPTNDRLVISLGLSGTHGVTLRVANRTRAWPSGNEALVFDDSFEHEVIHAGETTRAALIVHFAHPMAMPAGTNGAAVAKLGESVCDEGAHLERLTVDALGRVP